MLIAAFIGSWVFFLAVGGYFFTQGRKIPGVLRENREKIEFLEKRAAELARDLAEAASDVHYLQSVTGLRAGEVRPTPERIDEARTSVRVAKKLGVDDILYPNQEQQMGDTYRMLDRALDRAGL